MNPLALLLAFLGSGVVGFSTSSSSQNTNTTPPPSSSLVPTPPVTDDGEEEEEPTPEPAPEPAPAPTPAPTPTPPSVNTPVAPNQSGSAAGTEDATVDLPLSGRIDVMGGRVTTFDLSADDVADVRILSGVQNGNITVNSDNTLALVMTKSDFTGNQNFTYEVTHTSGAVTTHTGRLNVTEGAQANGWATGQKHYMLATDENDKVIVEHGENHTKVYVSESKTALSIQDIARAEGLNANQITGDWLAQSDYGQSENLALDTEAGMMLWSTITPRGSETSNWLLFERGHEYEDVGRLLNRDTHGESELNPLYVGAWGEGDRPEIQSQFFQWNESSSNLVVQDIHFSDGVFVTFAENVILDHVKLTEDGAAFQRSDGITIRNSEFVDIVQKSPGNGGDWNSHADRLQGIYMNNAEGILLEGNFLDKISWDDGYDAQGDGDSAMPPSMWSHNIYFGADMADITMRDSITMRASSYGAQIRAGGFFEDNVFLDNNAAFTTVGGDYKGAGAVGNYSLMSGNVVTSAAHKVADKIGALTLGIKDEARMSTLVDNIVAHLADPNSDELDYKYDTRYSAYSKHGSYYDDTIVYNWKGSKTVYDDNIVSEQNIEGLDTAALDQTTIQNFAAQLLGQQTASIEDLANYLRAQADGALDDMVDADLIIRFFQEGFGLDTDIREEATTLRFEPDSLGDGVRWDNRINWSTDDLPGLYEADNVDLAGNDVVFGTNAEIGTLDFGPDGSLDVYGGKLTLNGGFTGDEEGTLHIEGAGQVWTNGSEADELEIEMTGGRFVNTGDFSGADMTISDGQAILATENGRFMVEASDALKIVGDDAKVGFDGEQDDMAILAFEKGATLAFEAEEGEIGTIEEFYSGSHETSNVKSGINLGDATLSVDLTGLSAANGSVLTLMSADEIAGIFDDASIGGLGGRNATIVVDYLNDTVTLELTSGNGQIKMETIGEETDVSTGHTTLWDALTNGQGIYSDDASLNHNDDDLDDATLAA